MAHWIAPLTAPTHQLCAENAANTGRATCRTLESARLSEELLEVAAPSRQRPPSVALSNTAIGGPSPARRRAPVDHAAASRHDRRPEPRRNAEDGRASAAIPTRVAVLKRTGSANETQTHATAGTMMGTERTSPGRTGLRHVGI